MAHLQFRNVVKKYTPTDQALGVPGGTVGGIPVPSPEDFATAEQGAKADTAVQPDDLGAAASMSPVEVVTDETAHAALSGAFAPRDRVAAMVDPESVAWFDTFDRDDDPNGLGPQDSGGAWTVLAGTWGITSRAAKLQAVSTSSGGLVVADVGSPDMVIEASIDVADSNPGAMIVFRVTDASTYLRVQLSAAGIRLHKVVSGTATQIAAFSTTTQAGLRRRLRIVAVGETVAAFDAITAQQIGTTHTLAGGDETLFASQTLAGFGDVATVADRRSTVKNIVARTPF